MEKIHLKSVYIAGFSYYDGAEVFENLKVGTKIKLKHDKDNHYDENAVALYFKDCKLGYVPKDSNFEIAKVLMSGHKIFTGIVQQVDEREHPNHQIRVGIYIVKKMVA
jgi:hypothetical protein